jgi:hypothetical protein
MRDKYELIMTLRKLKMGQLARLKWPDEVPAALGERLQDCLNVEPQARPTAKKLLTSFEAFSREESVCG